MKSLETLVSVLGRVNEKTAKMTAAVDDLMGAMAEVPELYRAAVCADVAEQLRTWADDLSSPLVAATGPAVPGAVPAAEERPIAPPAAPAFGAGGKYPCLAEAIVAYLHTRPEGATRDEIWGAIKGKYRTTSKDPYNAAVNGLYEMQRTNRPRIRMSGNLYLPVLPDPGPARPVRVRDGR